MRSLRQFICDVALIPSIWRDAVARAEARRHAASEIGRTEGALAEQTHVRANLMLRLVALRSAEAQQ